MAENHPNNNRSPERKAGVLSSVASSAELSTTGSSDLQPLSLSRTLSLGHLASYTVPIRLDTLFFLLNSAGLGTQNALSPLPFHGGQMSLGHCHGPAAHQPSCCSCCHATGQAQPHGGTNPLGTAERSHSGYGGLSTGVPGNQNSGRHWPSHNQQGGGKIWPGWNRDRSVMGWKENPRQEEGGRGQGNSGGGSWQGRQTNSGRSWGDRRQGMADSASWKSGPQTFRRETFGSNAGSSGQRNQEGSRRQMTWDIPEAKRHSDDARMGRQKSQEKQQLVFPKAVDAGPAKQVAQDSGEDWEVDYNSKPAASATSGSASHKEDRAGTSKTCENQKSEDGPSKDLPKLEAVTSPPPKLTSKDQGSAATDKEPGKSHSSWSKNSGFTSYLKGLYSDRDKSSSDGSSNLIIDMDLCNEEQSPKSGAETVD